MRDFVLCAEWCLLLENRAYVLAARIWQPNTRLNIAQLLNVIAILFIVLYKTSSVLRLAKRMEVYTIMVCWETLRLYDNINHAKQNSGRWCFYEMAIRWKHIPLKRVGLKSLMAWWLSHDRFRCETFDLYLD